MFFGIEIKHNKNQAKPILLDYHLKLSQAVLEPPSQPSKNGKKEPVCLMVEHDKKEFILCVLEPQCWQSQLDLEFEQGDQIRFFLRGSGNIHLTGIKYREEDDALSLSISTDEEDLSDVESEGNLEPVDEEKSSRKRMSNQIPAKRVLAKVSNGKAATKPSIKKKFEQEEVSNEEEESSDDQDYILGESSENEEDDNEDESEDDEDMDDEDDEIDIDEEDDDDE